MEFSKIGSIPESGSYLLIKIELFIKREKITTLAGILEYLVN